MLRWQHDVLQSVNYHWSVSSLDEYFIILTCEVGAHGFESRCVLVKREGQRGKDKVLRGAPEVTLGWEACCETRVIQCHHNKVIFYSTCAKVKEIVIIPISLPQNKTSLSMKSFYSCSIEIYKLSFSSKLSVTPLRFMYFNVELRVSLSIYLN